MDSDQRANTGTPRRDPSGQEATAADQPIFPGLQELRDLPQRILPEETYAHLQNAGREALLALFSIWQGIEKARNGDTGARVRKRIDVE